jgi:hypothetical protein
MWGSLIHVYVCIIETNRTRFRGSITKVGSIARECLCYLKYLVVYVSLKPIAQDSVVVLRKYESIVKKERKNVKNETFFWIWKYFGKSFFRKYIFETSVFSM